jgi:hypothetical protein
VLPFPDKKYYEFYWLMKKNIFINAALEELMKHTLKDRLIETLGAPVTSSYSAASSSRK